MRLCDLCAAHPEAAPRSLDVDALIRSGLARFTDEVGKLWCKLADYYIRLGDFEDARDVYEEAVTTVVTVRDFSLAFDAYAQFEESVIAAKMKLLEDGGGDSEEEEAPPDIGTFRAVCKSNLQPDFNMRIFECFDTSTFAVLRELAKSNRFVQKSAESTSI